MADESLPEALAALPRFARQVWRAWATVDAGGQVIDPRYRIEHEFVGDPKTWWAGRNRRNGTDRRGLVRETHLTTSQIASAIGQTPTSVSKLFRGMIMKPTYDVIDSLARLLHVTPGYFFSDDGPDDVRSNVERGITDLVPVAAGEDPAALAATLRAFGYPENVVVSLLKVAQLRSPQALAAIDADADVVLSMLDNGVSAK